MSVTKSAANLKLQSQIIVSAWLHVCSDRAEVAAEGSDAEGDNSDAFSDSLSSWGSGEEIWGYDTDYYNSEEEAEAVAGMNPHKRECRQAVPGSVWGLWFRC